MRPFFPVTHSILDVEALSSWVTVDYGKGAIDCKLLALSLNDTFW